IDERCIELDRACRRVGAGGAVRSWKRGRRRRRLRRRRRQGCTNHFYTLLDELNARSMGWILQKRAGVGFELTAVQSSCGQGDLKVELAAGWYCVQRNIDHIGRRRLEIIVLAQLECRLLARGIVMIE